MPEDTLTGGCLCGKVRYQAIGPWSPVIACHCRQCRRTTGHIHATTAAARATFQITTSVGLAWYQSSATARRGFCNQCGSTLFFDSAPSPLISITAGTLDSDPGLRLAADIYVEEAGRYYSLDPNTPHLTAKDWQQNRQHFRDNQPADE